MSENTREIILDTLLVLEKGETFSHKLIKAVLDKYDYWDSRDKAFVKRVTEGSLERQIELDYYLNHFSSVPVHKMKPLIRCLLRMSVYQILYMDAVPDSAVCNEACKLAAKRKFHNLKGFVNGVLRNIAKSKESLPMPDRQKDCPGFLSVRYSMPKWIVEQWLQEYGETNTETLLKGLLEIHPVSLRLRTDVTEEARQNWLDEVARTNTVLRQSPYLPYVYYADNPDNISRLPGYEEGMFTIQDASSALAVEILQLGEKDYVVDICAAPGGKSLLAAEKAAKVLSRDVSGNKTDLIEENARRMGRTNLTVQVHDATVPDETLYGRADAVIMDVPCSGLGVVGKKRDIKYHVTQESLKEIVALQKQIVESSWQYVKPGGLLLYSTCTINRSENEEMVRWITEQFPFEPVSIEEQLPAELRSLQSAEEKHCLQLLPGLADTDGFFMAKLRRR